jgi:hypothetical protein
MYRYFAGLLSPKRRRQILPTLLALVSFSIILWAVITDIRNRRYAVTLTKRRSANP